MNDKYKNLTDVQKKFLELVPSPPELEGGKRWHVFISYRSVNRPWVLNLYDALEQVGFTAFLDQFELVPGGDLVRSLNEALDDCASGAIVWSTDSTDSEWCMDEYSTMHSMKNDKSAAFKFVILKLDEDKLPAMARKSLYETFVDSPEGPHGMGLLRLICGLVGEAPAKEAVEFATEIDQNTKESLAEIRAAKDTGDFEELVSLSKIDSLAWQASPILPCQTADALIALKKYDEAIEVLELTEERFPKSIRPKQLQALSLARLGQWSEAQKVVSKLYAKGHRDPETLGIYARTWMDRYKASDRRAHLEKSRDLYAEAFKYAPSDYYTGINAAAKSVFLDELEKAKECAEKVEKLVGTKPIENDYWQTATVAEVQLIRENYDEAARLYKAAVLYDPEAKGSHESTLAQARLLMEHLGSSPEQRQKIEDSFA